MDCCKLTKRPDSEKKLIKNRLNRIKGQLNGIDKMIDDDKYCNDVLIQIVAAEKSLKSLANHILENHLYTCISKDMEDGNVDALDELISLFKRFND